MSPLLANIYLHRFDAWYYHHYGTPDSKLDSAGYSRWRQQATKKGKNKAATQMFRYADDWIVTARGTKDRAHEIKEDCKGLLQMATLPGCLCNRQKRV